MKKVIVLSLFSILSFTSFSQQNSGYARGIFAYGLEEHSLPYGLGNKDAYRPGQALAAELGVNIRLSQFELAPHFGYSFNSEGYQLKTDSANLGESYSFNRGYLGLGAFYALPVGKFQITEVLIGGGILGALPSELRVNKNGNTIYTSEYKTSIGGYAEMKVRFESNIGVWIEPSVRMAFQEFNSTTSTAVDDYMLNANSIQAALAIVLPFGSPSGEDQ